MRRIAFAVAVLAAAVVAVWFFSRTHGDVPGGEADDGATTASGASPATAAPSPAESAPESGPSLRADAPSARPTAGAPPPTPTGAAAGGLRVHATVIDEAKKPVAGAEVEVLDGGTALGRGTTDERGEVEVPIALPAGDGNGAGAVVAHDATRIAASSVFLRGEMWMGMKPGPRREAGTLTLRRSGTADVLVVADDTPVAGASVRVTLFTWGAPELAAAATDASGRVRFERLPWGSMRVQASAPGKARAAAALDVPVEAPDPIRLELGAERAFDVLVVDAKDKTPIAGASVFLTETVAMRQGVGAMGRYVGAPEIPLTDAAGRTRVRGLARTDRVSVSASAPGYGSRESSGQGVSASKPDATEVTVALGRKRRVTWALVPGEIPAPPTGTKLTIAKEAGQVGGDYPPAGHVEGATVVVEDVPPTHFSALAKAPDGATARLWCANEGEQGKETSFRAPRRIDVTLRYEDGAPASGWHLTIRNQGNNPMGQAGPTDADGRASFTGLYGQLVEVYAGEVEGPWTGQRIGTVDLDKGSGAVEGKVLRSREAILRVRSGGKSIVPEGTTVLANFEPVVSPVQDDAAGTIRFRYRPRPEGTLALTVRAPGHVTLTKETTPPPGVVATLDVDLERAGTLKVTVAGGSRPRLQIHRWDEPRREWVVHADAQVHGVSMPTITYDSKGGVMLDALPAGRYRAVDAYSGAESTAVDLVAGGAPASVTLDLTAIGMAKGRVIVPEGFDFTGVQVLREGGARASAIWQDPGLTGVMVGTDGSFGVRVPGRTPVTLRPTHPLLVPAAVEGTAEVTEPREGIVLRMVRANTATLRFDREPRVRFNPGSTRRETVALFRGEPTGAPVYQTSGVIEGTKCTFGGFEPGRWTVWVDANPYAPIVMRDVTLAAGETDLGTVALSEGSGVKVTVVAKEGTDLPRLNVWASRTDGKPEYHRGDEFRTKEFRLTGLGRGTFQVTVSATMGAAAGLQKTVEVDGEHDAAVTLDLR